MGQLRKRGGVWWIRYYRNGRRFEESARTGTKEIARDKLREIEGAIAKGVPVTPRAGRLTFDDAAKDLETEYTVNGRKTLKHLQRRLKNHLTPWFGGKRLSEIGTSQIRAFTEARLKAGAAPAEVNRELSAVKRMFSLAVKDGRLHAKPYVPMLAEHNVRRGFLERDQFESVKAKLPARLRPVLTFAYLTGWRLTSEVLPLEWRQIDFDGRTVRLDPGTTKNGEGRVYPFTNALEALLTELHAEHERLKKAGTIIPFVFARKNGRRIKNVRGAWIVACKAAGHPGRLIHDMRRSAVRNLERDGVPRSAAMAMVGHKTESIYRRYAIVDSGALKDAAARIDRAAAAAAEPGPAAAAKRA